MESRLGVLMDNFAISGKDLASLLHIDSSLVSKWRNGKRTLRPNSVYTTQIIRHVMALDRNNHYAKIRMMLSREYMNIFKCPEQEIALFLKDWLTSANETGGSRRDYFDEIKNLRCTSPLTCNAPGIRQALAVGSSENAQYLSRASRCRFYSMRTPSGFLKTTSFSTNGACEACRFWARTTG